MSNNGDSRTKTQKQIISPSKLKTESRINRLKQIDAIYKSQIQQIYNSQSPSFPDKHKPQDADDKTSFSRKLADQKNRTLKIGAIKIDDVENISTSSRALHSVLSEDKLKYSKFVGPETTRTTQLRRVQNYNKDNKIKQLTNKCEYLLQKLRQHISANQFSQEVDSLSKLNDNKIQRFENLFKIKNQETFFKNKLQVISLLQDFEIPQEQINAIHDIQTEASLFSFLTKKIKAQLKTFKLRDQDNRFELHKDKILSEKLEERLTFLTETNQLLKISEQKLKQKNEVLKGQMRQFLEKLRQKQLELEEKDCELFRIKRQSQEMATSSNKVQQLENRFKQQLQIQSQNYQAKERQYKTILNNNNIEKSRLMAEIDEKECLIEEMAIKEKYLSQQNERINRELLRSKERYQWCEKELENKRKEHEEEKTALLEQFRRHKENNHESIVLQAKAQTEQAMRKVEEYQEAYSRLALHLDEEKKTSQLKYQQYLAKVQALQHTWLQKTKRLEAIREEELQDLSKQYEEKHQLMRKEFEKKEKLLADEMQAKMKALLAEKDKKFTQKLHFLEADNQNLKKELENLKSLGALLQNKK